MDGYRIEYMNPRFAGVLSSGRDSDVFIEMDSVDGFVGRFDDTGVQSVGVPGQAVDFRDRVVHPMDGGFTLVVKSRAAYAEARRLFSTREGGVLTIVGEQRVMVPVRLAESLPSPASLPDVGARVAVRLVNDGGVGLVAMSQTGPSVTVTNWGDVPISTEIDWQAASGSVTLPSGASFTLPYVAQRHTLKLDRRHAGEVYDSRGNYVSRLTDQVGAVAELVPVGGEHTFQMPKAAVMRWNVGVLDPWI